MHQLMSKAKHFSRESVGNVARVRTRGHYLFIARRSNCTHSGIDLARRRPSAGAFLDAAPVAHQLPCSSQRLPHEFGLRCLAFAASKSTMPDVQSAVARMR